IVAADHVGDTHVVIVDHYRKHIGWGAVRPEQDEVVDFGVLDGDAALHFVIDDSLTLARRFKADNERFAGLFVRDVAPTAADAKRPALGFRLLALLGEFLLRHVAAIGGAALQEPVGDIGMTGPELGLIIFVAVPIETEPAHA